MVVMDDIVAEVAEALAGRCEVPDGSALVAACSGGADSVVLVHALAACSERWPLRGVCFVDHGLRDVKAEYDSAKAIAERVNVPFHTRRITLPKTGNTQSQARSLRYAALAEMAGDGVFIATGHTQTDQSETLLHRVIRGTGLRGLAGIRYRNGMHIRPLLRVTRQQTRAAGVYFADDPTNATDAYLRNRLRQQVIPVLANENPRVEQALAVLAESAQDELELVDALVSAWDEAVGIENAPAHLAEVLVRWRLRQARPDNASVSRQATSELARHLVRGSVKTAVSLGGGLRGVASKGRLELEDDIDPRNSVVLPSTGSYSLGRVKIVIDQKDIAPPTADTVATLDSTTVRWPLTCRRALSSDLVLQEGHEVSLTKIMDSRGFTREQKQRQLVFSDGLGRILWVPGLTICWVRASEVGRAGVLIIRLTTGQ